VLLDSDIEQPGQRVLTMLGAVRARLAGGPGGEAGYTLVELLVATGISLFIAGVSMVILNMAVRVQPETSERAGQIQRGRVLIERVSHELRQGEGVLNPTSSSLSMITYVNSVTCGGAHSDAARLCRVTYTCSSTSCSRTEQNADGTGTGTTAQVVDGITGPGVFTYSPQTDPTYVGIRLVFPKGDGSEAITIEDGIALRNYQESGT
jgi:type II secretory pathway component PulJ